MTSGQETERVYSYNPGTYRAFVELLFYRGTGIRGLMRGMANLPKVTRSYKWPKTTPPGEFGVSKSIG